MELDWLESPPEASLQADDLQAGTSHYFIGADRERWRTNVPHYGRVRVSSLYPGVDVVYYAAGGNLEFDLVVGPGADPGTARFRFTGAGAPLVDERGDLVLKLAGGELRQRRPVVYQSIGGDRREITGRYVIHDGFEIGFEVGDYDRSRPLVIDPVLVWSSYLGGSRMDAVTGVALDAEGYVYVTGWSDSPVLQGAGLRATPAAIIPGDVFVTKLHPNGTRVLYTAYFGGTRRDQANAIAVTGHGVACVAGHTQSLDFPTTPGSLQDTLADETRFFGDAFVTCLNPAGSALGASTYVGGKNRDEANAIAISNTGDI